jgi:hypothetical protein
MNRVLKAIDSIQAALNFKGTSHVNFRGSRSLGKIGFCSFVVGISLGFHAALTLICTISLLYDPGTVKGRGILVSDYYALGPSFVTSRVGGVVNLHDHSGCISHARISYDSSISACPLVI